jgi:uncharacterized protein (TIRG00374 family)
MRKNHINSTISIIAISILAYLSYTIWTGWSETLNAIVRLGFGGIVLVLLLSLFNYALRFVRWHWYLSSTEVQGLSIARSLRYYVAGFAFTTTPGKAGEMVRSVFLKRYNVPYAQSLSIFFVERLSDLLSVLILGALILLHFQEYQRWLIIPVVGAIVLLAVLKHEPLIKRLEQFFMRGEHPRLKHLRHLFDLLLHSHTLLKYRFLYGGLLLGVIAWGAEGLGFYYILQGIGVNTPLALAIGIYSMSLVIGALSFLPAGLGGTEATMLILLTALGAAHEDAVAATLICRLATLWFAVILGGFTMIGLKLHDEETPTAV